MKKVILSPLFLLGLFIRLILIAAVLPLPVSEWYLPFLAASTGELSLDPWAVWIGAGGAPAAFPYGYVMWLVFLPLTLMAKLLGLSLVHGYGATLLLGDVGLLMLLRSMVPGRDRLLLATYWLSPIVIVATYLFGFNDLIPVLLLVGSLYLVRHFRLTLAGLACVAAISAKLSMVLALPFFCIYLLHNRSMRGFLPAFMRGLALGAVVMLAPFLFSHAGLSMLFGNPEMGKIYRLAFSVGASAVVYVVPLVYLLMLYATWRVRRLNFELFQAMLGIAFLLLVLLTPASPGWFIWAIPLLVAYQASSDRVALALTAAFSGLYVLSSFSLAVDAGAASPLPWPSTWPLPLPLASHAKSLLHTAMIALGMILTVRIWRETVSRNDFFRLSRKPFVIGVAGDSGAGKDTFSDGIKGLFGAHSVTTLSGDDYHLWDRQKPMWQVMTHLNPLSNDLEAFANDLVALTDNRTIQTKHYDHATGRMSRPFNIRSNDIIIASGLHALYLPILRERYNLSIYLDIDEALRRHFKLDRDVNKRGHTREKVLASFDKREPDSVRFIRTQASHADLVLSLQPIHARMLDAAPARQAIRFKLVARSRHGLNEVALTRVLVGICGLHVEMEVSTDSSEVELTIEGETSAEDIAQAAWMLCPRVFDFLDIHPKWEDGVLGLMQLITLSYINQTLTKRFK
jgi:uridine kinase